jgi:hypothetical protein
MRDGENPRSNKDKLSLEKCTKRERESVSEVVVRLPSFGTQWRERMRMKRDMRP